MAWRLKQYVRRVKMCLLKCEALERKLLFFSRSSDKWKTAFWGSSKYTKENLYRICF